MGLIAVFGIFALVTFLVTVVIRRAYRATALVVGSIPAALVAVESPHAMLNPLSWLYVGAIWGFCVAGSLAGAWVARQVHERRRRRRA